MELVSLGRQSVYPRVYLASYRGTSLATETMRRSSNRNSGNDVAQDRVYWRMFTKHSATHS